MATYYAQLKPLVLPRLTHYRDDLLKLDRAKLRGYTGEFLHGSRPTGTDLALMDGRHQSSKGADWDGAFLLRSGNSCYYHGKAGQVRKVSKEEAARLWSAYLRRLDLDRAA